LYAGVTKFKNKVIKKADKDKKIHLGLGFYLRTDNIRKHERTLGNACIQFWSILTLLTINKMNTLIKTNNLTDDVEIISTIYDSIYFNITDHPEIIKWTNDNVIPKMTKDFLTDQKIKNGAESDKGYDWADMKTIANNASIEEIDATRQLLKENYV